MASLFDQYEQFASSSGTGSSAAAGSGGGGGGASSQANKNEGIINLRTNVEEPIFAKNKIDFKPPNPITHMLVSSNQLLMAMENRTLLKIDLMDPSKKTEIDLNAYLSDKSKPVAISGIFLDPTGRHCIISLYLKQQQTQQQQNTRNSSSLSTSAEPPPLGSRVPYENFYYNKKLHKLTKLNGFVITAVGWNAGSSSSDQQSTTTGTGSILIGTSDGRIFETALQPDDRFLGSRELFLKQVADLPDSISGSGSGSGSSGQLFSGSSSQQMTSGTSPVPPPAGASSISEPICGLNVFKLPTTKGRTTTTTTTTFCVLAATSNFLYQYIGEVSAQQMQATSSSSSLTSSSSSSETAYLFHVLQSPSSRLHKEMPGAGPASRLDLYHPPPPPAGAGAGAAVLTSPKAFGWLTKPGIFFHDIPADLNGRNAARLFDDASMLMLSDLMTTTTTSSSSSSASTSSASNEAPISLVLTKFHLLLLYPSRLKVVCRLNQAVILEDRFSGTYGRVLGLCRDPIRGTVWAYAEHAVYRYKIVQEERNIWEIYLKKRDFAAARLHAGDDLLKQDRTVCEEALHLFSVGDYRASAALFAGARSRSFEEIALKFIELGGGGNGGGDPDQEALKEYLLCKLRTLSPVKERTQVIILLLWLLEISLNQLGRLANRMEDAELSNQEVLNLKVEYNRVEANLKGLISNSNYKAVLKKNRHIAYNLLLAHNAQSVLIYFAETMDDFERLLEHYLAQGELDQALSILRKEECLALYYRYSPVIVQERPRELVAQLMPLAKGIDFAKLIPALVHFDNGGGDSVKEGKDEEKGGSKQSSFTKRELQCLEILRFLEYCVFSLETDSSLVHNYLIALYAQYQPDKLLTYLQIKGGGGVGSNESGGGGGELDASSLLQPALPYDVRYAARLCTQLGLGQATVHLLATMGSIEEAVEQALADGDVELAKTTAERVSAVQRPEMAKRLWLKIAKHVIKKSSSSTEDGANSSSDNFNLKMATDLLNECPLLKIEDILPYFPAFSTIDHFKEAICSSLEEYNRTIETLREDMKVATESAAEIREEIRRLRSRYTLISATADRCALCEYAVLSKAFYAFNCGHLFHSDCLLDEVRPHLPPAEKRRLEELERSLMRPSSSQQQPAAGGSASNLGGSNGGGSTATAEAASIAEANRREEVYAAIDDLVASECLYCGHHMIASIDKPFIDPEETNALKGWD